MRRLTQEEFNSKVRALYGDKYPDVPYEGGRVKLKLMCPIHGEFAKLTSDYLGGHGCEKCGHEEGARNRRVTLEEFIKRSEKPHGNKYDYTHVVLKDVLTKVKIGCTIHGYFEQTPYTHMSGGGCIKCGEVEAVKKMRLPLEEFTSRSNIIHKFAYDYSKVVYEGTSSKVIIVCSKHGEFQQTPKDHLKGAGCKRCGIEIRVNKSRSTSEKFIKGANKVHNSKYDYSLVKYTNNSSKVTIICPEHGAFLQRPSAHLSGSGCPACASLRKVFNYKMIKGTDIEYSKNMPHNLYVMHIKNKEEEFWKVGVATNTTTRSSNIRITTGYTVKVLKVLKMSLYDSVNIEQGIDKKYESFKYIPEIYFSGYTECYKVNPLLNFEELITLFNTEVST